MFWGRLATKEEDEQTSEITDVSGPSAYQLRVEEGLRQLQQSQPTREKPDELRHEKDLFGDVPEPAQPEPRVPEPGRPAEEEESQNSDGGDLCVFPTRSAPLRSASRLNDNPDEPERIDLFAHLDLLPQSADAMAPESLQEAEQKEFYPDLQAALLAAWLFRCTERGTIDESRCRGGDMGPVRPEEKANDGAA